MFVCVDAKSLAQRRQQMVLVQLRVALHGFLVLDAFGNLAELLNVLLFELVIGVGHRFLLETRSIQSTPRMHIRRSVALGLVVLSGGLVLALSVSGQERPGKRAVTLDDVMRFRTINDVSISP